MRACLLREQLRVQVLPLALQLIGSMNYVKDQNYRPSIFMIYVYFKTDLCIMTHNCMLTFIYYQMKLSHDELMYTSNKCSATYHPPEHTD